MTKIILASNNKGKIKEVKEICKDMQVEIVSMKEAGIDIDIEENGTTFEENALIKAEAVMKLTGELTIADDSGLEVDYLNKEPGVYSARYMGHDTSYDIKNQAIIDRLAGIEDKDRTARFVCAMAAYFRTEDILPQEEQWKGLSLMKSKGQTASVMIRLCICHSTERLRQN